MCPGLEMRCEYGLEYTSSDCEKFCVRWGIDHILALGGRPRGNAGAEWFIERLKGELL